MSDVSNISDLVVSGAFNADPLIQHQLIGISIPRVYGRFPLQLTASLRGSLIMHPLAPLPPVLSSGAPLKIFTLSGDRT